MGISIIQSSDESKALLSSVISAADDHTNELGFLPPAAYEAQAEKGRLWVLVDADHEYIGHLMFSGHRQALKVTQMFVDPRVRRHGVGKQTIEAFKNYACDNGCQYIQARVAADLEANAFWEKNGFIIVRQVGGGESRKRLINERAWFVPSAALFDTTPHGQQFSTIRAHSISKLPSYVLDTNIVIDYSRQRSEYQDIEVLLQKTLGQELRLRGTPELEEELKRGNSYSETDIAVRLVRLIPTLSIVEQGTIERRITELMTIVFSNRRSVGDLKPNEKSDLVHLAYCIEHEQDGFVTRDGPVLRAANTIGSKYGLEILTPYDLAPSSGSPTDHAFSDGASDSLLFSWAPIERIKTIVSKVFPQELQSYIENTFPDWNSRNLDDVKLLVVSHKSEDVGHALVLWNSANNSWDVAFSPLQSLLVGRGLIDEVLQNIYTICRSAHSTPISIVLARGSIEIYQQALDNGFVACETQEHSLPVLKLKRLIYRGIVSQGEWPDLVSSMRRALGWKLAEKIPTYDEFLNTGVRIDASGSNTGHFFVKLTDFEKLISPGIVLLDKRPCALVPIKLEFARQLLPETEVTRDMLEGMHAGMYAERVYFSYSQSPFPLKPGGIIVFYVSGQGPEAGMAKALATVTSLAVTTEREARRNYLSRGVLALEDKETAVTVITFTNIGILETPVPFGWMKEQRIIGGAGLVTAQKITGSQLQAILNYPNS